MKALTIIPKKKNSIMLRDIPKPTINKGEVLVKVLHVGLDGTDKEIGEGHYGAAPDRSKFLIVGHEAIGVVEKTDGVSKLKVGDYVVATVRRPDDCINCIAGESDMCIKGNYKERGIKGLHGYLSEYYKEEPEWIIKIPKSIRDIGVLLEPMSIAEKAIIQAFKIQDRMVWRPKTAVVLGSGSLGIMAAVLLRMRGIDVSIVDRTEKHKIKSQIFRTVGIHHLNSEKHPISEIPKLLKRRIDIVVEMTGNPEVIKAAINIGGKNSVVLLVSVTGNKFIDNLDFAKFNYSLVTGNKLIVGIVNANKKYFELGVNDMKKIKKVFPGVLESIITKRIKLNEFSSYDILHDRSQIKIVVDVGV